MSVGSFFNLYSLGEMDASLFLSKGPVGEAPYESDMIFCNSPAGDVYVEHWQYMAGY
jgi:hypothetical protein